MGPTDSPANLLRLVNASTGERPPSSASSASSDRELVLALRHGQSWAARAIWDRHSNRVHRFLVRALGPSQDVEDLTQEVFLRIFARPRAIRDADALPQFVMAVAVRVLKWQLRYRWVRRNMRLTGDGTLPDPVGDRASAEETRQAVRLCYRILDALGTRERTAYTLRFLEEMTVEEVAATLNVSTSTAKRLINRAAAAVAAKVAAIPDLREFVTAEVIGGGR
jgi:RNA polymerase sigma-70 factor (ECF subfamily)